MFKFSQITEMLQQLREFMQKIIALTVQIQQLIHEINQLKNWLTQQQSTDRAFLLNLLQLKLNAEAVSPKPPEPLDIQKLFTELPVGHPEGYSPEELFITPSTTPPKA